MIYVTYTRKIADCLTHNCELLMKYEDREAIIWYYDKKKDDVTIFNIKYELGLELSTCNGLQLDGGNWETGEQSFRIDYDAIKDIKIRKNLVDILKKYDASYQPINLKDLKK